MRASVSRLPLGLSVVSLVLRLASPVVHADQIPAGWQADNMTPIGYSGLDDRGGAFKMVVRHVGDRWYLYSGHEWHRGWTILDVTDPANPKFVKFVSGPDNTNSINIEVHGNTLLTALQKKYISDKNWGIFILRYTGRGEPASTAR